MTVLGVEVDVAEGAALMLLVAEILALALCVELIVAYKLRVCVET